MDPYLESDKFWPVFQHQLVACLYQMLLPGLVDRYKARVGHRKYTTEIALFTSVDRVEHHEQFIEIRQRNDTRLVTLLDVISPANKTTTAGRQAYVDKRNEARAASAGIVEIDLVLQGKDGGSNRLEPLHDYSREGLPDWDYAVTVTRATQPDRHEIYTSTLQKRLPRFRLPLASDDRDTVVDLQTAFNRCYDQGGFAQMLDYQRDPPYKLDDDDLRFVDELLRQQKLRT
jgi:hypothetical protein